MNILLFLTPKDKVAYIYDDFSIRQALEKMEHHRYSAVPLINKEGVYIGTITEGDLLWFIKNKNKLDIKTAEKYKIVDVPRKMDNKPVRIDTTMEQLVTMSLEQNFVPVIDDRNVFIGIITRKDIIKYCYTLTSSLPVNEN